MQNQHLYTTKIPKHWTPIQPISKEIQVGANSSHVITHTQYPYINHPKYTSIEIYGSQGTMLLYDKTNILDSSESITNSGT
jgi:hypothetical protein